MAAERYGVLWQFLKGVIMDFNLSPDNEILRDSVRRFAEKEIRPVAGELDKREEFSYETMRKMAELGLFGP